MKLDAYDFIRTELANVFKMWLVYCTTLWLAKSHWHVLLLTALTQSCPECFITANLDQPVTKEATAI